MLEEEPGSDEHNLLTSEWHFAVELSKEVGAPGVRAFLRRLSSRDFTDYRAAALVNIAQSELAHAYAERKAKRRGRR